MNTPSYYDFYKKNLKDSSDCYPEFPTIYRNISTKLATNDLSLGYSRDYLEKKDEIGIGKYLIEYGKKLKDPWPTAKNLTNPLYLLDINPSKDNLITKYQPLSRAYYKIYEILVEYDQRVRETADKKGEWLGNHLVIFKNKPKKDINNKWEKMKPIDILVELKNETPENLKNIIRRVPFVRREKLIKPINMQRVSLTENQRTNIINMVKFLRFRPIVSVNLAEGPGSFMEAIMNYRKLRAPEIYKKDLYFGITIDKADNAENFVRMEEILKEYKNQMVLIYGEENGNLYNSQNINKLYETMIKETKRLLIDNETNIFFDFNQNQELKADIVTGDGGFDFRNKESIQEQLMYRLILAQIVAAFRVQAINGNFILKIFDIYTKFTMKLINLITQYYKTVDIVKPQTSRPANSEKYIVAKGFCGIDEKNMNNLLSLLEEWFDINDKANNLTISDYNGIKETYWNPKIPNYVWDLFQDMNISREFILKIRDINLDLSLRQMHKITETLNLITISKNEDNPKIYRNKEFIRDIHYKMIDGKKRIYNPITQKYINLNTTMGKILEEIISFHYKNAIIWLKHYNLEINDNYKK
jgi:23S rRNA U2552 (ribose-2'-O)-methylase RlmE/FtsJ